MLPFFFSSTGVGFGGEVVLTAGEAALPGTFGGILLAERFCTNCCVQTFLLKYAVSPTVEAESGLHI